MKKSFAFDKINICYLFTMIFFLFVGINLFPQDLGMIIIEIVVAIVFGTLFLMGPNYYIADNEGIYIYYFLFAKDYYKWDEIKKVREYLAGSYKFRYKVYLLETTSEKNKPFYMSNEITKSMFTKRLIKKYWDGEINGDEYEDFKKKLRKKRAEDIAVDKKQAIKDESEAREKITDILREHRTKAKENGHFINVKYIYEVEGKIYKERPDCSYSFVADIEIGKIGTSDDESVFIMTELLFVRYGKTSIKVIPKDDKIYSEISEKVGEGIRKI